MPNRVLVRESSKGTRASKVASKMVIRISLLLPDCRILVKFSFFGTLSFILRHIYIHSMKQLKVDLTIKNSIEL